MERPAPAPKLRLFARGWSEVPDHAETLARGVVFDISEVGHAHDRRAARWRLVEGYGSALDAELGRRKDLYDILTLLKSLCLRFAGCIQEQQDVEELTLAMSCGWGKHRSRWVVVELEKWADE